MDKMKRLSMKRLPKLFSGKRQSSERENGENGESESDKQSMGNTSGLTVNDSRLSSLSGSQTTAEQPEKKKTGNAPPISMSSVAVPVLPPKLPAKEEHQRRTFNVPAINFFSGGSSSSESREQRKTANAAPIALFTGSSDSKNGAAPDTRRPTTNTAPIMFSSGSGLDANRPVHVEPPASIGSIEALDDFSLRRLLDKRMFDSTAKYSEVILVIRLANVGGSNLAASISKVLNNNKEDRRRREILVAFTRVPDVNMHCVAVGTGGGASTLSLTWSFPLTALLTVREQKRGIIVLQFQGGKERKIVPLNESERGWLFYCVTRIGREYAQCDPTIMALSSMRAVATEDTINARCPFLLKTPNNDMAAQQSKAAKGNTTDRSKKSDVHFAAVEFFDDEALRSAAEEEEAIAESFRAMRAAGKRSSLLITDEESKVLNRIVQPRGDTESVDQIVVRVRGDLEKLEKETLAELRAWEAGEGPALVKKSLVDLDHGRKGDPIASLLAHLESVDSSLGELEGWMNDHEASVAGMTSVARRIDTEIKRQKEELEGKETLAKHLTELLEDLTPEDDRVLSDLSNQLPLVQRELETFQKQRTVTNAITKATRNLASLRDRGGKDCKLGARKERFEALSSRSEQIALKLGEFIQGRIDYYYRFERSDVRECHGRLSTYAEVLSALASLSPAVTATCVARYQSEACTFAKAELAKVLTEPYFSSGIHAGSTSDQVAKFSDSSAETAEAVAEEREAALKDVHMPGAESRRRFMSTLIRLVDEEDALCTTLSSAKLDFAPGLASALQSLWPLVGHRASTSPLSLAAPILCDMMRLRGNLKNDHKLTGYATALDQFIQPLDDIVSKFLVDQVGTNFEKTKRAVVQNPQQVFVRKLPFVLDRLWAASQGLGPLRARDPPTVEVVICPGTKIIVEAVLEMVMSLTSPLAKWENIYLITQSIALRGEMQDALASLALTTKFEQVTDDAVTALLMASPFAKAVDLADLAEEQNVITKQQIDEAGQPLQGPDRLERAVAAMVTAVGHKISTGSARKNFLERTKSELLDAYWSLAEAAAENLGVSVIPSAAQVRDVWNKVV